MPFADRKSGERNRFSRSNNNFSLGCVQCETPVVK